MHGAAVENGERQGNTGAKKKQTLLFAEIRPTSLSRTLPSSYCSAEFRSSIPIWLRPKNSSSRSRSPLVDDEDEQTLAAIDEGIRDAKAGRTVSPQEVRKLLPKWTTVSS